MSKRSDIAAALAKLMEIKNTPRPPYFDRWNGKDFTYGNLDDAVQEGFEFGQNYGEWRGVQDTIDVQMSVLQDGLDAIQDKEALIDAYAWDDGKWTYNAMSINVAVLFADAINGSET